MSKEVVRRKNSPSSRDCSRSDFKDIGHRILGLANQGMLRFEFMQAVSRMIAEFSGCDPVELRSMDRGRRYRCIFSLRDGGSLSMEDVSSRREDAIERLVDDLVRRRTDSSLPFFTDRGSFWSPDLEKSVSSAAVSGSPTHSYLSLIRADCGSLALLPFRVGDDPVGLLDLRCREKGRFTAEEIAAWEDLTLTLGVAMAYRRSQRALRERVKELTCLYGISRLVERPDASLEEILQGTVDLLPPGWLYPEIASSRIVLDGRVYQTRRFREGPHRLTADIVVEAERRGTVETVYAEERPVLDEGPFLKEERNLIDSIAREVSRIVEHRQAYADKAKLQDQLRHADRLATLGQLAAGVAHELNEPLGNILGFAQLAEKCGGLPEQAAKDIGKITSAALYSREIIRKLLLFSRQMPVRKIVVDLNRLVREGLSFFESRCAKEGIELVARLSPRPPLVRADLSQLNQALVNLVVNAIQAMPDGGKLTVRTVHAGDTVTLAVEDTGTGIGEEALKKIFLPFYTTKETHEGTGLGLAVVHGIVTSHKGSIQVASRPGQGTRFEILLPAVRPGDAQEAHGR